MSEALILYEVCVLIIRHFYASSLKRHSHAHKKHTGAFGHPPALAFLPPRTTSYRQGDVATSTTLCRQAQGCFFFVDLERLADATADVEAAVRTNDEVKHTVGARNKLALLKQRTKYGKYAKITSRPSHVI